MKKAAFVLFGLAVLLSDVMCAHVAYLYRAMLCGIEHMGYSAPAGAAFLYAIPYAVGIAVCVTVGIVLFRKAKK
jgi:hypothetical protein